MGQNLLSEELWIERFDNLAADDYLVIDGFMDRENYESLRFYFDQKKNQNDFESAGIGALSKHQINKSVRGDFIHWISRIEDPLTIPYFDTIDELVGLLKRYCFLSISDYEFHMAHYPIGSFYKKHLDQFNDRNNRLISCVFYLNENWKPADGGQLKLFLNDEEKLVEPMANRLVIFKSDTLWHEVLPTTSGRDSITGWLLFQPKGLGFLS
jgi:SM-20-related protein